MRRSIFLALAVLWMAVIFGFSARDGDTSARDSYRTSEVIGEVFIEGYDDWVPSRKQAFREEIDFWVRKGAHFSEYALLALLWLGFFFPAGKTPSRRMPYGKAWLASVLYACTDEMHQLFVSERAGSPRDVCIDGLGAAAGLAAAMLVFVAYGMWKNRKRN